MDTNLQVYDEYAARSTAAYEAFKSYYAAHTPAPEQTNLKRDWVSLTITLGLIVVMLASILVSGSRTVEMFGGGAIGMTAFVMLECGILVFAFFRARRNVSDTRLSQARRLATMGLSLTVLIALGANLDETLRQHGVILGDGIRIAINVLVALSAPTLAFLSSDIVAIELMSGDLRQRAADREFQRQYEEWVETLNRSWVSQKRNWGVSNIVVETSETKPVPILSQSVPETKPETKSGTVDDARDWLGQHPETASYTLRQLEEVSGFSRSTLSRARK